MWRTALPFTSLLLAASACQASNCDAIRDSIDAKIRAAGVSRFTLSIVDVGTAAAGRNVGSCERGSKKIMYVQGGTPAAATSVASVASEASAASTASAGKPPQRRGPDGVITECKNGAVAPGGSCPK